MDEKHPEGALIDDDGREERRGGKRELDLFVSRSTSSCLPSDGHSTLFQVNDAKRNRYLRRPSLVVKEETGKPGRTA